MKYLKRNFLSNNYREQDNKVLYGIIGTNVAIFCVWSIEDLSLRRFMRNHFTLSAAAVWSRPHTLLTSMFSHYDIWHLGANMVSLYFFGASAINLLGARAFLQLYLSGGLFSSKLSLNCTFLKLKNLK